MVAFIAVVGPTSPLGRRLVSTLLDAGHHVRCVVRDMKRAPAPWRAHPRCELATGCGDAPDVVWLAHARHVDAQEEIAVNVRMLEEACQRDRRLVFISSGGSVYGEPQRIPVHEDHARRPLSAYGMAKCAMEDIVAEAAHRAGAGVILRPGNIYGPEYLKGGGGAVAAFTRSLLADVPVTLRDGGRGSRDFVYVDDVVRAIAGALTWQRGLAVWNVGTGVATRTRDVLSEVSAIVDRQPIAILHTLRRPTDVSAVALASTRIHSDLGWKPAYALTAGLWSTLRDVREELSPRRQAVDSLSSY